MVNLGMARRLRRRRRHPATHRRLSGEGVELRELAEYTAVLIHGNPVPAAVILPYNSRYALHILSSPARPRRGAAGVGAAAGSGAPGAGRGHQRAEWVFEDLCGAKIK